LSEEFVYNFLQSSLLKDGILGYTSYSVHKDDYTLLLNGLNSLDYASLGQQKISYMSLFLAALEVFKKKYEAYPVLLIDDMSSELDNERWQGLLAYLANVDIQVFITTANENFLTKMKDIKHSKCYKVEYGKVLLIN
jgi:DNA replication and repair protein RecF